MDQEFSTRQTTERKSRRSSFRMDKSDIWDPARFGVGAHPVCAVHQRSTTGEDRQKMQQDIDELLIWSKKWQFPFNESKCKVMHYGKTNRKADYNLGGVNIKEVCEEKDLGVTFAQQLSFGTNAGKVVAAANSRLGLINRHFRHLDTKPFMNLYKTLDRPKME